MYKDQNAIEGLASSEEGSDWNTEDLVEQVWNDLAKSIPRPTVQQTVTRLLAKYDDATIRRYVPLVVRREARELLRYYQSSNHP